MQLIDFILHIDRYLGEWAYQLGPWTYVLIFLIVFAETGLVVTPFLPGDSLLFAIGALCSIPETGLNVWVMGITLFFAALIGDNLNYFVGSRIGPKVFSKDSSIFFNKKHLERTQAFYNKHGGKTIVLARFMPIVRTFAPFVAGVGRMNYLRFLSYSIFGALFWITSFLYLGFMFGNLPAVKSRFHIVIIGVIILSVLPIFIGWWNSRKQNEKSNQ
jgi:membrane-associated protein